MADYQIKKGVLGQKVLYNCPGCGSPLTSSFDKAGTQDSCPDCHRPHVIPGIKERQALEQAAAAKQQQQDVEAEKKRIEEAARRARLAKENAAPVTALPSALLLPVFNPVATDGPKKSNVRRRRFGDGVLDAAFATTRGFSVFVIFVSLAALVIVGILIMEAYSSFRPQIAKPVALPAESEYAAFEKSIEEIHSRSTDTTSNSKFTDRSSAMIKKHHLDSAVFEDSIRELQSTLIPSEFDTFLSAFDKFVSDHANKPLAARWFCSDYHENYQSKVRAERDDELYNIRVSGRIAGLSTAALAIFGGLISFMVLPLLIRIEANTRELGKC